MYHQLSSPLSCKELAQVVHFLETTFHHFQHYESTCEKTYLDNIQVISSCYSLVLVEAQITSLHDQHINRVRQYRDFKQQPDRFEMLSSSIAHMINFIADNVSLVPDPWFKVHFVKAVKSLFSDRMTYLQKDMTEVQRLAKVILK
jgi:hypothetical protein